MTPLFRADQVGSLIRPAFLLEERGSLGFYDSKLSEDQAAATSASIKYAVQKQIKLGIRPITSG
ncbi:hypothetical protein BDP81DRAFT_440223 [Colletotrichum phormii]|uniref:Uncharacterized protein n=1 Tax=Colletotrichum phormii TaxID=359342 RepID=A0AAJ0EAW5_9PEZI|nr:uncharacterized protein BDP81DRAFT_440223 [Colletotrichum phormii]KAK1623118.1 hypothetical protein BDP81DRAFT_440223 [Colletotrichum phormii]